MGFFWWLIFSVLTVIPFMKLLPFFGIKSHWAFAAIIPVGPLALLWWMAIRLQEIEKR